MFSNPLRMIAVAALLVGVSCAQEAPQNLKSDLIGIEGLWSGSWGGGGRDGVVVQPVIAEMVIHGDKIKLFGFRNVGELRGIVHINQAAKRIRITPAAAKDKQPAVKDVEYSYELKDDKLTLTDADSVSVHLLRHAVQQNPLANVTVELVAADGINEAGDLRVTQFTVVQVEKAGPPLYRPENRVLKTKRATVLQLQESGVKKISLDEARRLLRQATPVVISFRDEDPQPMHQFHELRKDLGSASPESEAVWQTYLQILRPGTLTFVLSAKENAPVP